MNDLSLHLAHLQQAELHRAASQSRLALRVRRQRRLARRLAPVFHLPLRERTPPATVRCEAS